MDPSYRIVTPLKVDGYSGPIYVELGPPLNKFPLGPKIYERMRKISAEGFGWLARQAIAEAGILTPDSHYSPDGLNEFPSRALVQEFRAPKFGGFLTGRRSHWQTVQTAIIGEAQNELVTFLEDPFA